MASKIPLSSMLTIGLLPSPLKKMFYRLKGAKIGKNVSIGLLSIIKADSIEIGNNTKISPLSIINVKSLKLGKRVKIGMMVAIDTGEVEIDDDSIIMEKVIIGGMLTPRSKIKIGKRVKIFLDSFINPTEPITIGDDVGIGGSNYLFTHGSWKSKLDGYPVSFGPITIEKGVWLPWRVFIMPNVTIGEDSIIGANSLVSKNVPPRSIAAGSPAKIVSTEGKFIKKYSLEQKHEMVLDMLRSFSEYADYIGYDAHPEEDDKGFSLTLSRKKSKHTVIRYQKESVLEVQAHTDMVISLTAIEKPTRTKLESNKTLWFDIESKEATYSPLQEWEEIKNFFGRYGERFDIIE